MNKFFGFLITCLIALSANGVSADIVLRYQGEFFDDVQGSGFAAGTDRITSTITFMDVGALRAQSISIETSQNGSRGFSFEIDDFSNVPGGLAVHSNSFGDWVDGLPTSWELQISGNIIGDTGDEDLAISSDLGDTAALDIGNASESAGLTFSSGQFSGVPEPSSVSILLFGSTFLALRRRKK
jgi:hypothetical protein